MTEYEREIGKILEGIENLKDRYTDQEGRLSSLENSVNKMYTAFAGQPAKCLKAIEAKFVTQKEIEPLQDMHKNIKKASLYLFCSMIVCLAIAAEYIRRMP